MSPATQSSAGGPPRVAVVEDEDDLREAVVDFLAASGYPVWGAGSAEAAFRRLVVEPVDVVLLDLGLPGEDGYSACRHLRRLPTLGIIVISARHTVEDRVAALEAGADVYLQKPAALREVVAHVEALFRRLGRGAQARATSAPTWQLVLTDWRLIAPDGAGTRLSALEFNFLRRLVEAGEQVRVSKREIADSLWGNHLEVDFARIDVLLTRLRKKCQEDIGQALPVKTVTAYGYVLTVACRLG